MAKSRPVTIRAFRKPNGKIDFDMIDNGVVTDILVFNKSTDGLPKSDEYDIDFTLQNDGVNLAFLTQQNKPGEPVMYLAKGSATHVPKCPDGPTSIPNNEFQVGNPTETTLRVKNKDDTVCFYKFVLRFLDKDTGEIEDFDPIYGNQNGGRTGRSANQLLSSTTAGFIAGAALGVLLTVVAYSLLGSG